jgi:hypothetical protein
MEKGSGRTWAAERRELGVAQVGGRRERRRVRRRGSPPGRASLWGRQ